MRLGVKGLLLKLWIMCISCAFIITFIYIVWADGFDSTYYKLVGTLSIGYLPYTLFYKKLSSKLQHNLLFVNMSLVTILISLFLPFFNHMIIIFLPLLAILSKSRKVFYCTSIFSLVFHFGIISSPHDLIKMETIIKISYFSCYLILLSIIVNMVAEDSKTSYIFTNTVKSLILAIETKDMYTRGHSTRVSDYSMIIGEYMYKRGYKINLEILKVSSLIHDIGKVYIPVEILNKSGKLTTEEFKTIQKHSELGAQLAQELEYPKQVIRDILYHHERFDGKGYPNGLKGNEIPLHSRIIALADTFDAITTTRSYRAAHTVDEAKEIILSAMGSQFDPELRETYLNVSPLLVKYFEENSEHTSQYYEYRIGKL